MSQITMLSLDEKTMISELDRAGYRKMGVQVRSAKTWGETAKILAAESVDVIVINMDLPSVDGIEVIKHIKASSWKEVPIVATSVQVSPRARTAAVKVGADLFVEQPVPRDYFIEKIKALLDHKTRSTERVNPDLEVSFMLDGKNYNCEVGDLSVSGVLLATEMTLAPGTHLELAFLLGANNKAVKVKGEVVRRIEANKKNPNQMTGLGVRFTQFTGDSQQRIESFIARKSDKSNKLAYYL
ncbi:MAG: response regulator [Proteobacteria bacterium]|nr:response regulator [Pseudomonadota bacterium]